MTKIKKGCFPKIFEIVTILQLNVSNRVGDGGVDGSSVMVIMLVGVVMVPPWWWWCRWRFVVGGDDGDGDDGLVLIFYIQGVPKRIRLGFCLVSQQPSIGFSNSFFHLKADIHTEILNTNPFLYNIRGPRYLQNEIRL